MLTGLIFFGTLMVIAHSRYSFDPDRFASLATIKRGVKRSVTNHHFACKAQVAPTEPFARRFRR